MKRVISTAVIITITRATQWAQVESTIRVNNVIISGVTVLEASSVVIALVGLYLGSPIANCKRGKSFCRVSER